MVLIHLQYEGSSCWLFKWDELVLELLQNDIGSVALHIPLSGYGSGFFSYFYRLIGLTVTESA